LLSNVRLSKSLQIYKKNREFSKAFLKIMFSKLVKNKTGKDKASYIFKPVYKEKSIVYTGVRYSFMTFKFEEEPSFLEGSSEIELKYAYLLIIENNEYVFISKKNVNNIEKELESFIEYFDYENFSSFKGDDITKYEKISMGNMTISDSVIRSRSYEASNLNGILPMSSSSRAVPRNIRINNNNEIFSITPNTSRIGQRSTKSNIDNYIEWCLSISEEIQRQTNSKFIKEFAKPISLEKIMDDNAKPIGILFHFQKLENNISNDDRLYFDNNSFIDELDENNLKRLFTLLRNIFDVKFNTIESKYFIYLKGKKFAELKLNNKSFTIKDIIYNNIYLDFQKEQSLLDFINNEKNYTIVFDKPKYSYMGKYAFSDEKLLTISSIKRILSIFKTEHSLLDLGPIESEKCKPTKKANETQAAFDARMAIFNVLSRFPQDSLFYRVEKEFKYGVLICDDMGNEWADHININNNKIAFIHSKFTKKDSYGASAMHEVVAQALKNIGRVHASVEEYESNFNSKWYDTYQDTHIPRTTKDETTITLFHDIKEDIENVYLNPNSKRQIYLATPFFSKSQMENNLNNLVTATNPNPHYIQLIWLISSFISSCQDYGIEPYILCKD
jgi:hypothetical protein